MTRPSRRTLRLGLVLATMATTAVLAGCAGEGEDEEEVDLVQTTLEDLEAYPGHHTVTFSKLGARRADVGTTAVTAGSGHRELPHAALLYDADGSTFVYVATGPLSYRYTPITLLEVVDDTLHFTGGPKPGEQVVTSGLPQVHGADIQLEFGEIA